MTRDRGRATADALRDVAVPLACAVFARILRAGVEFEAIAPLFEVLLSRVAEIVQRGATDGPLPASERRSYAALAASLLAGHFLATGEVLGADAVATSMERARGLVGGMDVVEGEAAAGRDMTAACRIAVAIGEYAFGHEPAQLGRQMLCQVRDAATRLAASAQLGTRDPDHRVPADDLTVVRALVDAAAGLYVEAHRAEKEALLGRSPHQRRPQRALSLDGVQRRFQAYVDVLQLAIGPAAPAEVG